MNYDKFCEIRVPHPGEILAKKIALFYLHEFSELTDIDVLTLLNIIEEKAPITEEIALRLSNSAISVGEWINLQGMYDNREKIIEAESNDDN